MTSSLAEFRQAAIAHTLRRCPLFADVASDDLNAIAAMTAMKSLAKGAYLFWEGAPVHGFYIVKEGAIKLHRLNMKGQEQVFHIFRPTESFAEEAMFSEASHSADASATEDSRVLLVQKTAFLDLLKAHRQLALRLLKSVSQHVRSLMSLVDDLTLKDANTRLASWLIERCPDPHSDQPQPVQLQMTKRLLASELGIASETLSRTLARFRSHQLVRVDGRTVILNCPMRLAAMVRNNVGPPPVPVSVRVWTSPAEECADKLTLRHQQLSAAL